MDFFNNFNNSIFGSNTSDNIIPNKIENNLSNENKEDNSQVNRDTILEGIDVNKLIKNKKSRNNDGYTLAELKAFARDLGINVNQHKGDLVDAIKKGRPNNSSQIDSQKTKVQLLFESLEYGEIPAGEILIYGFIENDELSVIDYTTIEKDKRYLYRGRKCKTIRRDDLIIMVAKLYNIINANNFIETLDTIQSTLEHLKFLDIITEYNVNKNELCELIKIKLEEIDHIL